MKKLIFLMATFYLIQAFASNPGLAALPLSLYLKETLRLTATEVANFQIVVFLPWIIKPFWGGIFDSFTLFNYQFKSYFILFYAMTVGLFIWLSGLETYDVSILTWAALLISTCIACADVLTDRLMILQGQKSHQTAILQSAQWAALGLGSAAIVYLGGHLAALHNLSLTFLLSAIMPLAGVLVSFVVLQEEKVAKPPTTSATHQLLWQILQSKQFWLITSFIAWIGLSPTPPVLFYERDYLRLSELEVGTLQALESLAMGLGAIGFGMVTRNIQALRLWQWTVGFSILASLVRMLLHDTQSAPLVHVCSGLLGIFATLGTLEVIARACPVGLEATTYTLLISVSNLTRGLGLAEGAWLYDRGMELSMIALVGALTASLGWFLIPLMRQELP